MTVQPEPVRDYGTERDWAALREFALAAKRQLEEGPPEWPGRPSRQRLELFLAASPGAVLALLDERDALARRRTPARRTLPSPDQLSIPGIPEPRGSAA